MKFVTDVKRDIIYKIMKFCLFVCFGLFVFVFVFCFCFFFFGKNVSFLNYVAKYPNWLLPDYHGNQFTNPASFLCVLFPCVFLQIWCQSIVSFLRYICSIFSQSLALLGYHGNQNKTTTFFITRHHGLQYGTQHSSADIWESCVKRSPNIYRFWLNHLLELFHQSWKRSDVQNVQVTVHRIHL